MCVCVLLDLTELPSLNEVVAQASGMLAWQMSRDGHALNDIYTNSHVRSNTRAATNELVIVTDCLESIGVRNAQRMWNECQKLRTASSVQKARRVLKLLSEI